MLGVLIDIDGVIYEGERIVPGAAHTIDFLQKNNFPFLFLTNTSSKSVAKVQQKLRLMGVEVSLEKILTPAVATRSWIRANQCEPTALFIPNDTLSDFSDVNILDPQLEDGAESVVIGDLGESWDYHALNRAFRLLISNEKKRPTLIALGMTKYFKDVGGLRLDVAPFVKALEFSASCDAIVMGKPARRFFQAAANKLEMPFNDLVMIGDDIVSDIQGAQRCGMSTLLVKTGKFRGRDLQLDITPNAIFNSIAELPEWLVANSHSQLHQYQSTQH